MYQNKKILKYNEPKVIFNILITRKKIQICNNSNKIDFNRSSEEEFTLMSITIMFELCWLSMAINLFNLVGMICMNESNRQV